MEAMSGASALSASSSSSSSSSSSLSSTTALHPRQSVFFGKPTPLTFIHAPHGNAPYLTMDILTPSMCYHIPIGELCALPGTDIMQKYGKGLHQFANMKNNMLFFSVRDVVINDFGPANNDTYSLSGQRGKKKLSCKDYMDVQATFSPNGFACMSDEIPSFASMSRASKSVSRSIAWLDECLKLHSTASYGEQGKPLIFATIQGAGHESLRIRCSQEMAKRQVDGFVLGGLCAGENVTERKAAVSWMLANLPSDKIRILPGLLGPVEIIEMVLMGVDVVDSPYPYTLTRMGCASTYSLSPSSDIKEEKSSNKIQLRDKVFERDASPLVAGCRCYTCQNHHRAYIHHLLNVHEMLADTLLMLHNLHHHLLLFDNIREHVRQGTLASFAVEFQKAFLS